MTQLSTHLDIKEDSIEKEKNISKLLQLLYSLGRFNGKLLFNILINSYII